MNYYVAVISSHGKPREVRLFDAEEEARRFARDYSAKEGFANKAGDHNERVDHAHESHWLEDWGDDDGCGVVVGPSEAPHSH